MSYTLAHSAETPFRTAIRRPLPIQDLAQLSHQYKSGCNSGWSGVWIGYQHKAAEPFSRWIFASFSLLPPGPVGSVRWWIIPIPPPARRPSSSVCISQYRCVSDYLSSRCEALFLIFFCYSSGSRNVFRPSTTPTFSRNRNLPPSAVVKVPSGDFPRVNFCRSSQPRSFSR